MQCRPLRTVDDRSPGASARESAAPLAAGGVTVFPGRAVGPVHRARTVEELLAAPEGALLVLRQAGPEIAAVLPRVAGVVAEQGSGAGHAAALVREFAIPTLFGVPGAEELLGTRGALSLDATRRQVFEGILWPEVRERVRSRLRHLPKKLDKSAARAGAGAQSDEPAGHQLPGEGLPLRPRRRPLHAREGRRGHVRIRRRGGEGRPADGLPAGERRPLAARRPRPRAPPCRRPRASAGESGRRRSPRRRSRLSGVA